MVIPSVSEMDIEPFLLILATRCDFGCTQPSTGVSGDDGKNQLKSTKKDMR